jgi:hypothetical protein
MVLQRIIIEIISANTHCLNSEQISLEWSSMGLSLCRTNPPVDLIVAPSRI